MKHQFLATLLICLTIPSVGASVCAQTPALRHYEIRPADLPPPNPAEDAVNPPRVVPRPARANLIIPPGFSVDTSTDCDFREPRWLAFAPTGHILLTQSRGS